jgi:hemerythrin-like metal-binding protein
MSWAWSNNMSVGNASIDSEHKSLFIMLNGIDATIKSKDSDALLQALQVFAESTRIHFDNEENIARAIKFPFEEHKQEHDYVLNEMQTMWDELASHEGKWSESVIEHYYEFLTEWTIAHIRGDDMRMKEVLKDYPYDFTPPASPG